MGHILCSGPWCYFGTGNNWQTALCNVRCWMYTLAFVTHTPLCMTCDLVTVGISFLSGITCCMLIIPFYIRLGHLLHPLPSHIFCNTKCELIKNLHFQSELSNIQWENTWPHCRHSSLQWWQGFVFSIILFYMSRMFNVILTDPAGWFTAQPHTLQELPRVCELIMLWFILAVNVASKNVLFD